METKKEHKVVEETITTVTTVQTGSGPGSGMVMPTGLPPGASPPIFEQIFRNARFVQGGDALFEGKVTGNPKPTINWIRKGQPLQHGSKYQVSYNPNNGVVTLQICAIGPGDEGEYICNASNEYGEAICTVYIQPEAAYMMQQQRMQQQQSMQTSKQQQQQIQRQQQYQKQVIQTTESFRVDTFEYRILHEVEFRESLTKRHAGETDISQKGPLQGAPQAPNVQQKPRSTKVTEHTTATLTANVTANPNPRVIWFRNGERIFPSSKHTVTQTNNQVTLTVKDVTNSDNGWYTMLAENPSGCTVASAQLAVVPRGADTTETAQTEVIKNQKTELVQQSMSDMTDDSGKSLEPKFVKIPPHQTVQEGKLVRFDCRVTGRPYPEVTWYLNGEPIANDANHKTLVNESGNHSLMITQASLHDAGVITCVARNKSGETSFQVQLNVLEREQVVPPKFVERFQQGQVSEGETVQLHARAVGTPTPTMSWQKGGVNITPSNNVRIQSDGGSTVLEIVSASPADAGWYQCTAQNVAGSTSTRARLHVKSDKKPATPPPPRPHYGIKFIDPEKEPGPEVLYLRHIEPEHQPTQPPEAEQIDPPRFTHFLRSIDIHENNRAHFEATVIPIGDATMQIEWLKDGRPIKAGSRITATYRFGYVALDILNVIDDDSGVYTCRATNAMGQDETSANLRVTEKPVIITGTQHPDAMDKIAYLEDQSRYQRTTSVDDQSNVKPFFVKPISDIGEIMEGKYAHFEAQVHPVNDPNMKIDWFKDGKPITASSRTNMIFNFGYVALTMMQLRTEDTGIYTVRASNKVGECSCQAAMRVVSQSSVTEDLGIPEQAQYIRSVEEMEAYRKQMKKKAEEELLDSTEPPIFKTNLKDASAKEGGYAHFESRLEPVGDPTLKVEWLKDGRPIEASSRITTFFNFGYVALTIKSLTPRDAGVYTCRAYNAKGEAVNQAKLAVVVKKDIDVESQFEDTALKMQFLEDASRHQRTATAEESYPKMPPRFLGPLKGTTKILEGQNAHFEVKLEPQNDPTMKIDWYFNGKNLMDASRIKFYNDFGYIALDISDVRVNDTGNYTVVARNAMGEAQISADMQVEARTSIDYSTLHDSAVSKTSALERRHHEPHYEIEEITKSKPIFTHPLQDLPPFPEGKNVHLEARLEPMGDPTMKVEWYLNGKPITVGSRFRTYFDFGFVALDIIGAYTTDSGEYTCRAENALGSAHTSACVKVLGSEDIETETMFDGTLDQIALIEAQKQQKALTEDTEVKQPPTFTKNLKNLETFEGTHIHLEARLQPVGDSSMKVEWFFNDAPLKVGHRFKTAYDFDYVALDLLNVYPVDSGIYTCRASNRLGQAVTSASVKVIAKKDLIFDSEHPDTLQKLQYLEDTARYQRHEALDEAVVKIKPKFLTQLKDVILKENMTAHFEAKLEPITDANLRVEWYKDGRPLTIGSRFRTIHDFGYVALDIRNVVNKDSGIYTCVATNLLGRDEVTAQLTCKGSSNIIMDSQTDAATTEQLRMLEDRRRYDRTEDTDQTTTQAPVFTSSLKNIEILEGQRAHFEARLIPISDPTMKVQWFCNNKLVKSGSRFTEFNDFGFVALDIMGSNAEDSGTYTCVATNALGQAITSASLVVHTKDSIILDTMNQDAMQKIANLEARGQRTTVVEEATFQAPVFTSPIKDQSLTENAPLHFEARLIPVGDPDLKVEWFRNGAPLQPANRISTMHDFGYVALDMKYVKPEDTGTYTCRATNKLGQAVSSAKLMVLSKEDLLLETQHGGALEKLRRLEETSKHTKSATEETVVSQPPKFSVNLSGLTQLWEGQSAHVEGRIEPYPDPTMKVEWFHNGKPLSIGHRFRTMNDFGFCALDILSAISSDSGTYECRATNRLGTASSTIDINVKPKSDFIIDSQHPEALAKIKRLEQKSVGKVSEEPMVIQKPNFVRALMNQESLVEGQAIHMEATLTPVNDPTMKVEWFFNGTPIKAGHRFKPLYDFGYVAMDMLYAYAEDSGTYMCKATNAAGQAVTSCEIKVEATDSMLTGTLDEDRLRKIRKLEEVSKDERPEKKQKAFGKPVFTTALQSQDQIKEGNRVHLECRLEPINDPNLKVEWFVNGVEIKTGHRFRTTHDFGYVALDILYAYAEDSGNYLCKATNLQGEAVNSCSVKVDARRSIYMDSQHPSGWEKIQTLEQKPRYERMEVDEAPTQPPRFTSELRGVTTLGEGQRAHIEGRIEPINDSTMKVEWYHNGRLIPSAARCHTTHDFGYVALDLSKLMPNDSGEYVCRAVNKVGEATSTINLKVEGTGNIIYESPRPDGLARIKELEAPKDLARPQEELRTFQRPVFTQPLQNLDKLNENDIAHFECRLIPVGDPNLKVEWFKNEKLLEQSSRISRTHDFGYVALDIKGVRNNDEGIYMCRAYNDLGEAVTTASMKIQTESNIQLDSQHPEGMKKIKALEEKKPHERVEHEKVFEKPVFTTQLQGPAQIYEGENAHFECKVIPVGDPNMKFEWYCNGVELKMGSRFFTTNDFGFITLDIMKAIPEDSGVYMCKAYNLAGEAVSSCTTRVIGRRNIIGDSAHPEGWEKIQLRETQWNRVPQTPTSPGVDEPPIFTKHLESFENLQEGGYVTLEAQVQPSTDPHLSIEWFKNGVQLTTGTRVRSTFDFGHVLLHISGLRENDSGIYTCRAVNRVGEATSTCNLKIHDRDWFIGDSNRPGALPKIAELEKPKAGPDHSGPEPVYDLPVFITHLNNVECWEGDTAHFECNVEPSKDPTMKIEWFINGKPLQAAARYSPRYDFGYVSLDCTHCYAEDSGVYMCKATNSKGSATTTGTLKCISKANIYLDTQHPQGKVGLEKVEQAERAFFEKNQRPPTSEDAAPFPKPVFIRPLEPNFSLMENQNLHLEANVEPKKDPNLKIEWFLNGKPLVHGSRYKSSYDFGLVTLDLNDCYERDQGIYTCRAFNKAGEAFCTTTVVVGAKGSLIEGTQHPAGDAGLEAIHRMEESLRRSDRTIPDEEGHPPVFTTPFKSLSNIEENEIAHFEAMLTPVGDESMKVEWLFNGQPLKASHRVRTVYAFGMVVLEVLGTKVADTGEYTCRAKNKWGQAECSCTLEVVDRAHGQPPRFTTHIKDIVDAKDGHSGHFECTLVPVGDPNMKIEWFHNGQPLRNATRIKTVNDFGYVVLDIAYLRNHDSGEWVCRASNKYGEDFTKAHINCTGKGGVIYDSLQPGALGKIAELESGKHQAAKMLSPTRAAEPPKFITQIGNIDQLKEGQSAHFEAKLTPVSDPDLVVEWYKDGVKLPHKHRYRTFHDFGIVILDILYCYEEDSGVYEARAVNKLGEDRTKATLNCSSKSGLILTPQIPKEMEGGLEKIQQFEDAAWMRRKSDVTEKSGMAPKFTVPLSNIEGLKEGENAHFEARIIPTDDPRLKVEWYYNGRPLKHSSRIRHFFDFGFVIMEMSTVYAEDSGEYLCRAYNDYGEAVTKCILKCEGRRSVILDSQLPKSMQSGMGKIAELEGLKVQTPDDHATPDSGQPPQFITQPADASIGENQLAHFECRLLPVGDPTMRVEWYQNGRPLRTGSRIKTIHDFGYVILEIANCYARDAGTYTCRAINKHGEATAECKLNIATKSGLVLEPQSTRCTEAILKLEEDKFKKDSLRPIDEEKPNPPRFITELQDITDLVEGQPAHFDCRVEPVGDPTMRIDWFHNGAPLAVGSRVHMMDDFGFVVLDLEWTFGRDSGEYVCRATNKWGQATTKAFLNIKSKHGIDLGTQLPEGMTAEKLKELERGPLSPIKPDTDEKMEPPKFIVPLKDLAIEEGEPARFEADVIPKNDPYLRVEWYVNGKPLQSGHRFRTSFEMGHAVLELLYTYPEDSGEYICRAVNRVGQDLTKAQLKSKAAQCVIMQSQAMRGGKPKDVLTQMEEAMKKHKVKDVLLTAEDIYDVKKRQPPRFVTQIQSNNSLQELGDYKFDCQLTPVGDPNMKVEWFFNGRPLPYKNRFTPIYDFGYVALIMGWVYSEDSGEYLCRATNKYGMDETRAFIKCTGRPGVIYDSQIPKGMQSLEKIRDLESSMKLIPSAQIEEEKVRSKPEILKAPETILVQEGSWARFSIRVSGYPKPRVMWVVNGSTAISGNRFKIWYDGMFHLDIPKTRQYDEGKIEVIARNSLGEAYATCNLKVKPRQDDYRAVLKNSPRPWYDTELKGYQTDRMDSELERVFEERVDSDHAILHKSQFGEYMAKPVSFSKEPEWQKLAREKNAGEKIKELEDEQRNKGRVKESRAFAEPSSIAQDQSLAKGMASRYESSLKKTDVEEDTTKESREAAQKRQQIKQEELRQKRQQIDEQRRLDLQRKQQEQQEFLKKSREIDPLESSVHGKEVHTSVQKQKQKEIQGDVEIHRNITTTEKSEVEHKAKTTERLVSGDVKPSKPPFFTKKIQPCRAVEKQGARFEVEFEGDPRPTIQWFREDFPITSSTDFQIHTFGDKSVLLIREVFMEDSGVFAAVAENRGGRAKCSANLIVEEPPKSKSGVVPPSFTTTIQDVKMKQGSLVRLDAKLSGTHPIDIYWMKDGTKLQDGNRCRMVSEGNQATLLIMEAIEEDTGTYECVAINKAGEGRCQADVVVTGGKSPSTPASVKGSSKQAPQIIEKMKGQIVPEGQSARFECVVSGTPAPIAQWKKGNQIIRPSKYFSMTSDNNGRYIMKISQVFPEDEGTYKCILKNMAGQATVEAPLKVTQQQQLDVPPTVNPMKDQTVVEGGNLKLSTGVSGKPPPKVEWYREGTLIPNNPDFEMKIEGNQAVLYIKGVYPEDTGIFTCRATNSAGQAESSVKVIVKRATREVIRGEQPMFHEVLQPTTVKHGEPAILKAKVRGYPTPRIVWYHADKELPHTEDFLQEFHISTGTAQLTIKEVFIDDRGLYRAVAINEHGVDETTGYLTVEDIEFVEKSELRQAPRITVPLQSQLAPVGSPVVLRALYQAYPPPTIKWYKDEKEIKPNREFVVRKTDEETTLEITELFEDDYGEYQVRIFSETGEARSAATVLVIHPQQKPTFQPPLFVKPLAPQIIPRGEMVILEAEVKAIPEAEFTWYRHGEEILPDEEFDVHISAEENKSTLIIGELHEDDAGDYTVTAVNTIGRASSTATLLVENEEEIEDLSPPEFIQPIQSLRVMDGERVRFTGKVTGKPLPTLSWFHNGRPVDHHREIKVMQTPDGKVGLLISEVFPEDEGDYTCIARNKAGEARCIANLSVESYEYQPDSELATATSVSDNLVLSGTASEDEILDIEKDSESDSEAGTAPFFSSILDEVVKVEEGTPVRLIAKAEGYPQPTVSWYLDDRPLESTEVLSIENFEDGTASLTIESTIVEDCGLYTCEAINRNGIDTSKTQLVVSPKEHHEGTKHYRKPEWVVKAEKAKEIIPGIVESNRHDRKLSLSSIKTSISKLLTSEGRSFQNNDELPNCETYYASLNCLNSFPHSSSQSSLITLPSISITMSADSLEKHYSEKKASRSEDTNVPKHYSKNTNASCFSYSQDNLFSPVENGSSISLGDLSMGSDSVFASEGEEIIDISTKNTVKESFFLSQCEGSNNQNNFSSNKNTPILSPKLLSPNYAHKIMNNYICSHRNSISQVIKTLDSMTKYKHVRQDYPNNQSLNARNFTSTSAEQGNKSQRSKDASGLPATNLESEIVVRASEKSKEYLSPDNGKYENAETKNEQATEMLDNKFHTGVCHYISEFNDIIISPEKDLAEDICQEQVTKNQDKSVNNIAEEPLNLQMFSTNSSQLDYNDHNEIFKSQVNIFIENPNKVKFIYPTPIHAKHTHSSSINENLTNGNICNSLKLDQDIMVERCMHEINLGIIGRENSHNDYTSILRNFENEFDSFCSLCDSFCSYPICNIHSNHHSYEMHCLSLLENDYLTKPCENFIDTKIKVFNVNNKQSCISNQVVNVFETNTSNMSNDNLRDSNSQKADSLEELVVSETECLETDI